MNEPHVGELRHLLSIQKPERVADGSGGIIQSWSLVGEVWAGVRQVAAREAAEAGRLQAKNEYDVWIRWRAGMEPDMRFLWGTRILEIKGIIEVGSPVRWLRCVALERLP